MALKRNFDATRRPTGFFAARTLRRRRLLSNALDRRSASANSLTMPACTSAMCERRMQSAPAEFTTAEENYNYGIARLNTRELAVARALLRRRFVARAQRRPYLLRPCVMLRSGWRSSGML